MGKAAASKLTVALAGNPNCGKTALFNALTGGRSKVGNYPGVTVERKEGGLVTPSGLTLRVLDLPGTYSLHARTPDEEITRDVLLGRQTQQHRPDLLVAVADATSLERSLGLILELRELGKPVILALNMMDLAKKRGLELDLAVLSRELRIPVVPTVATQKKGLPELLRQLETRVREWGDSPVSLKAIGKAVGIEKTGLQKESDEDIQSRFAEVDQILRRSVKKSSQPALWTDRIDRVVLHPFWGTLLLIFVLGTVFQAIFSWAEIPMEALKEGVAFVGEVTGNWIPEGALRSLMVDGVIAGVGSVVVFLPQILLLFAFIIFLEDLGYLPRAAFLMDRLMSRVGLHGRAFIPLLSSFACAIPGIMATRTIENRRDRLTTILVAPLMTCSARLPIYSLLIAAFIPNRLIFGPLRLQGVVMLSLYAGGIAMALIMATVFRHTLFKGGNPPLLMELPSYKWPSPRNLMLGLWERGMLFIEGAGTMILSVSVLLWFLSSYPKPPVDADAGTSAIAYSYAGKIGHAIEPLVRPLGFNWKIGVALIPAFAAREVIVGSLATVYAVENKHVGSGGLLADRLSSEWSVATAMSLLVWYLLACQCFSTLAVTRRETGTLRWPAFMLIYMTTLAYGGSWLVYRTAVFLGWG